MTLKELLETKERIDYDVCNSLTDEIFPSISLPMEISKEGCEEYSEALALEVKICDDDPNECASYIIVDVKTDEQLKKLRRFMYAQAGYIKDEDYSKLFTGDLFEISKIVIKGGSGWCIADEAYDDKVTVTRESISYEYRPMIQSRINPTRKWSYKTTSPIFTKLYADLVAAMPAIVKHATDQFCTDVGWIEFILTFSDKTKFKQTFFLPGDEFKDCFQIIKRMIPECEYVPAVLLTKDDYED